MSARYSKSRIKGLQIARSAQKSADWVFIEFLCIAGMAGFAINSWWAFFGALVILILINFSPLASILFFGLSLLWGYIVYVLTQNQDAGLQIPLSIVAFLASLVIHNASKWWNTN